MSTPRLITVEFDGRPLRVTDIVAAHLGIIPGERIGPDRAHQVHRSNRAHGVALTIMAKANAAIFPNPCGTPHLAPDPGCPECKGHGRKRIPMPPPAGSDQAHRVENCRTCIQPYPRRPKPRLAGI